MHDQLFFNHSWAQTGKNPTRLFRGLAEAVGVDVTKYDACMASGRFAARIEASRLEGEARGVGGTPTFFVNGRMVPNIPDSDQFKTLVEQATPAAHPR